MKDYKDHGTALVRLFVGLLLLVPGITKLLNPAGIQGLVGSIGFPAPEVLGWLVIICEIVFGITVILGYKLKYTVWPLVIILAVALIWVAIPSGNVPNIMFHLLGIAALISLVLTGPGAIALDKKKR